MSQRDLHRYHTLRLALERRITGTLLPDADGRRDLATTGLFRQANYSVRLSLDRHGASGLW